MCCEDVKIGANAKSAVSYPNVAATTGPICGPSPDRQFLAIGSRTGGTVFVGPDASLPAGVGFPIPASGQPLFLSVKEHGAMVKEAWYANSPTGPFVILVVEGIGDNICGDSNGV
jgi:hypothetical protein